MKNGILVALLILSLGCAGKKEELRPINDLITELVSNQVVAASHDILGSTNSESITTNNVTAPLPNIRWLGANYSGAKETTVIRSVTIRGNKFYIDYAPYSWPKNSDGRCDAIVCFFYMQDDQWVGGKFDWWRVGGQKVKGTENIEGGYGGHVMPTRGTESRFMAVSVNGKERSNLCPVKWE